MGARIPDRESAKQQLRNLARCHSLLPCRSMPDVHWGCGATVGSVITHKGAIIPAAVGVDIGCGMAAQRTTRPPPICRTTCAPCAQASRRDTTWRTNNGAPGIEAHGVKPCRRFRWNLYGLGRNNRQASKAADAERRAPYHMGTLGTGNHFVEICLDEEQRVGSCCTRDLAASATASEHIFIEKAKKDMERV